MPSQIQASKGLTTLLPCGVQKDSTVSVHWHWTKDGAPVDKTRMKVLSNGSLRINTVLENDAGTYVCQVESEAGNDTTSGTLIVQGKRRNKHARLSKGLLVVHFLSFFCTLRIFRLCGLIVRVRVVPRRTVVGDIDRRFDNLSGSHHQSHVMTLMKRHDSDDDFRSGCRNVGQCHQQQSFSGLLSPGRSNHTNG